MGFRVDFFNYFRAVNGSPLLKIMVYNKPVFQKLVLSFSPCKKLDLVAVFQKLMAKAASENSCTENKDFHFMQTLLSQLIR